MREEHFNSRDDISAYSNVHNNYFSFDLYEIITVTSVDLLVLSNIPDDVLGIDKELGKYNFSVMEYQISDNNFKRRRVYKKNASEVFDIIFMPFFHRRWFDKPVMTLYQPTPDLMHLISSIFMELDIAPIINKIELAWDFYVVNCWGFIEHLERHLFLKYQRTPSRKFKNTYYYLDQAIKTVFLIIS